MRERRVLAFSPKSFRGPHGAFDSPITVIKYLDDMCPLDIVELIARACDT